MRNLDLVAKAKKIKLAAFDVDGVMTDGSLTFGEDGREFKTYNAKDGQGIVMLNHVGFKTAIITARENPTVNVRAKILNITKLHHGIKDKFLALQDLMQEFGVSYEEIAYMGDDLPDICVLEKVGIAACPNDAVGEVKEICNFVSEKDGGRGAVRELCNFILAANGISWKDLTRCK